jgi:branched-chain amino acid transport system substrate-binding protein
VAAKTPIRLAVACPMSGSAAAFGEMIQRAAKLKAQEVNAAGGIHGSLVELSVEDDRGNTTEATNIARRITADPSICLVIGHFNSTCTNAAKEEYNRKGVPEISPGSTNVNVCVGYPWTFRNLYRDDYQGTFLARYARKVLNMAKVAVFYDNDDYGKGLMQAFVKEAKEQKLGTLDPIAYIRERTQDFKPLVSEVKDKGVDGVFVAGLYNEGALIAKAAVTDLKMAIPVFGGEGLMNGKFIEIAGAAAEGAYVTTPFLFNTGQDTEEAITFMKNFERQYGIQPDTWAALTYDAVGMALDAVRQVGPDRKKIRDWLASITTPEKGYKGVTGNTYFDEEGDCYSKGAHVAIVRDGKFVPAPKQLQPEPDGEQE